MTKVVQFLKRLTFFVMSNTCLIRIKKVLGFN